MRKHTDRTTRITPLKFMAAAHDDLMAVPERVRREFGYALFQVQCGEMPIKRGPGAKDIPL